jgi:predicted nucleic acid-binding protein
MIVLDTNVLSELMRPSPAEAVVAWVSSRPARSIFTTAVTHAELLYGVLLLPDGRRRRELEGALEALFEQDLADRVLPFDELAVHDFAYIAADRQHAGRPIAHADAQIAAICRSRGAAVATRNVSDFEGCGLTVVNPFEA